MLIFRKEMILSCLYVFYEKTILLILPCINEKVYQWVPNINLNNIFDDQKEVQKLNPTINLFYQINTKSTSFNLLYKRENVGTLKNTSLENLNKKRKIEKIKQSVKMDSSYNIIRVSKKTSMRGKMNKKSIVLSF